jgi:hypothetical protein
MTMAAWRSATTTRLAGPHPLVRAFRHVGEQIDEIDGLELVFERRLPLEP